MNLAVTESLPGAVPMGYWLWILVALFAASGVGFLAGALLTWYSSRSQLKRALAAPGNLMPVIRRQLEDALEAAEALKSRQQIVLSQEETAEISDRRDSLLATLTEIVELQQQVAATLEGKPRPGKTAAGPVPFEIVWQKEPSDELTKLPPAEVMAMNLQAMLAKGTENQCPSGFLFIKLDGFEKLEDRHGAEGRDTLLKKFASVIIRASREEDLVCRYDADTMAVLFPSLEEYQGPALAHAIRKSLLNYHFRLSESGPAVILNAHFGYTDCLPHENDDLILNRAGNALAKSQSRGFNQMHIHDGEALHYLGPKEQ